MRHMCVIFPRHTWCQNFWPERTAKKFHWTCFRFSHPIKITFYRLFMVALSIIVTDVGYNDFLRNENIPEISTVRQKGSRSFFPVLAFNSLALSRSWWHSRYLNNAALDRHTPSTLKNFPKKPWIEVNTHHLFTHSKCLYKYRYDFRVGYCWHLLFSLLDHKRQ